MHKKVEKVQPSALPPKGNNVASRNTKSHPKTLAIPITTTSSSTSNITSTKKMILAQGSGTGDKRSSVPSTVAAHNRTASPSPRRGRGQQKLQQSQKIGPVSANSTSSSSSTSSCTSAGSIYSNQLASICREVALVRDEHVAIRNTLSEKEGELGKTKVALRNLAEERDLLRNKVSELEQILKRSPQKCSHVAGLIGGLVTGQNHSTIMSTMATSSSFPIPPEGNLSHINNNNSNINNNSNKLLAMGRQSSSSPAIAPNHNHIPQDRGNYGITGHVGNSVPGNTFEGNQKLTGSRSWPDRVPFPSSPSPVMRPSHNGNGGFEGMLQMAGNSPNLVSLSNMFSSQTSSISNINSQEAHQMNNNSKGVGEMGQRQYNHNYKNGNSQSHNHPYHNEPKDKMGQVAQSANSTTAFQEPEGNGNRHDNENGNDAVSTLARGGEREIGHHQHHHLSQSGISGLDLMLLGSDCSTKVVEHLVHPWTIQSSVREIEHRLVVQGSPLNGEGVREVEIEVDRLNSRIDHLRSQNDVLTLNLEDAKGHADRLTELLGKYESNNVALQLALRYSDQMTDTYEVLVALLETEMGQVLANLHARGQLNSICSPPSPNNNNTSPGSTIVSRPSGNNNNSNDNSPSEQVPTLAVTTGTIKEINGSTSNSDSGNQSQYNNNQMVIPTTVACIPDKLPLSCPSSSGVSSSSPSPKAMDLIEQAGRNRMVAERAARFLLSRFSPSSSFGTNGLYPSETNSSSFPPFQHHQNIQSESSCTPSSTPCMLSSSTSANSNLSNISGESGHHSESPFSSAGEMKAPSAVFATTEQEDRVVQPGATTEVTTMTMLTMTTRRTSSGGSPATSTTSSTFRAPSSSSSPFSPNGNEHPSVDHSSIIPSLLPFLEDAPSRMVRNNSSSNGIPISSDQSPPSSSVQPLIRNLISTLKAERDGVRGTVVKLESESLESMSPKPISPSYGNGSNNTNMTTPAITSRSPAECSKMDLETAVLMQELMAMKEERAELRAQVFLLEKEKGSLELRVKSHESQEEAYTARINYLKSEMQECKSLYSNTEMTMDTYPQLPDNRNRNEMIINSNHQQQQKNNGNNRNLEMAIINNNNNNQNGNWEREALLKKRIHELASTLERVAMGSQLREKENEEMINELNRANGFLMQTLEASKKKYQNRIKKMEDQILYVSERHAAQMKLFGASGTRSPGMGNYRR